MSAPVTNEMFLRFYNCDLERVEKALSELYPLMTGWKWSSTYRLTESVNPFLPPGSHWQVDLHFDSEANCNAFYENPEAQAIYRRYATNEPAAKFQKVAIGDACYGYKR